MKNIILGICGGVAAYKSLFLARLLRKQGLNVQPVCTPQALHFVSPLTLEALCQRRVRCDLFDEQAENAMSHIELARWADAIIIAPATANSMARLAAGFADDLLSTLCLASDAPVLLAPAMNRNMWQHPATQSNIARLSTFYHVLPVAEGAQACGEFGLGRMLEPEEILQYLNNLLNDNKIFSGKRFVITAGPTQEALDPVRYLSNHSSGKMAYALAHQAQRLGAEVTLISGPVALATPPQCQRIDVVSACEMQQAVMQHLERQDVFIACAAVADYRAVEIAPQKIKKTSSNEELILKLRRNPDILAEVAALPAGQRPSLVVGFAAETEQLIAHAQSKLERKKLDVIVANPVGAQLGFGQDDNQAVVLWRQNGAVQQRELPRCSKEALARHILQHLADLSLV